LYAAAAAHYDQAVRSREATVTPAQKLRDLLAQPGLQIMPGCFDALSAKLVAAAGFKVTFMSGFAVSAARLGLPDTGLISFAEMLDSLRNCASAAAGIPLIGDGDTGYGNALNVQRTVIDYARAGAAAVMIEDQVSPKKCGHTRGKDVVSRDEARLKIRAAVDAKADADILIMARTDARAVAGFDAALERCRDFEAEGADIIFLEAPESEDEMRQFCQAMRKPCLANMVPGGKTPILPPAQLQATGYKLALYPVMLLSSAVAAMQATLGALRPEAASAPPPSVPFTELQRIVGFPDYWEREGRYKTTA
jgi:2-methylisocitrate lyase-like PEP mutase family enzyme